jgi:hypothetical protein
MNQPGLHLSVPAPLARIHKIGCPADRITFNAHILETGTESYRLRTSKTTARRKRTG